jgi:large subunit ribosomal protein L6
MSRIGKLPVAIEKGVEVKIDPTTVRVKGPKGELAQDYSPRVKIEVSDGQVLVTRATNNKSDRALHGTYRALIANMITGVTQGYSKALEIQGVGYRAAVQGKKLVLALGKSHPIEMEIPTGIEIAVDRNTNIKVTGIDKQIVGQVSANIRAYYPPEPYLGKGIRYVGEHVRRKAGKTVG